MHEETEKMKLKKAVSLEGFVCLALVIGFFVAVGSKMGLINAVNTMLNTSFDLLMNTVFYIMAIAVIAGALSGILTEFGVISLANRALSPLMKPVYGLPGAAIISVCATYFSDNPAVLSLCDDKRFLRYFKKYQLPVLTNIGTAFGMGLIITVFMVGIKGPSGENYAAGAIIGNVGAIVGSIVSARLMLHRTKKVYGTQAMVVEDDGDEPLDLIKYREVHEGSVGGRLLNSLLEGGKSGVNVGVAVIPGVLVICTLVLMLTNGPGPGGVYTGAAGEGVGFLPWVGEQLSFILAPLFGFTSPSAISVPITALGAAGAAIGLVPEMVAQGQAAGNDIAVFTAMCMCWSGYLSTHVAMMDGLKCRKLTGAAIVCHTIGGLCAGISANLLYKFFTIFL